MSPSSSSKNPYRDLTSIGISSKLDTCDLLNLCTTLKPWLYDFKPSIVKTSLFGTRHKDVVKSLKRILLHVVETATTCYTTLLRAPLQ
ncbi:hypothetical protein J6590_002040 [Homalodisca vitripennis]|nr:hypothetical protein J6590_002040 [Homalodisca vitripennis]